MLRILDKNEVIKSVSTKRYSEKMFLELVFPKFCGQKSGEKLAVGRFHFFTGNFEWIWLKVL